MSHVLPVLLVLLWKALELVNAVDRDLVTKPFVHLVNHHTNENNWNEGKISSIPGSAPGLVVATVCLLLLAELLVLLIMILWKPIVWMHVHPITVVVGLILHIIFHIKVLLFAFIIIVILFVIVVILFLQFPTLVIFIIVIGTD